MSTKTITVKNIRGCQKPNMLFTQEGRLSQWHVNPGETFLRGAALFEYRFRTPFDILSYSNTGFAPESGVLLWRKNWPPRSGGSWSFLFHEVIGKYIPLEQWRGFSETLQRHERIAKRYRETGRILNEKFDRKKALEEIQTLRKETADLKESSRQLEREISDIQRDIEENRKQSDELQKKIDLAVERLKTDLPRYPFDRLVADILTRCDELKSPSDDPPSSPVSDVLRQLVSALEAILSPRLPLPVSEVTPVRTELGFFFDIVRFFASTDREIQAALRDTTIPETEREIRIRKACQMRRKFTNTVFQHSEDTAREVA